MDFISLGFKKTSLLKIYFFAFRLIGVLVAPLACIAQPSVVTPLPANVQLVQTVEGITEYKLSNGLRILLAPDAANDRVTVNMIYMVGSRHEGYGETGMAHLLEHLIFKGSPKTPDPKSDFGRRGFTFNGTTSVDRTNYFASFQYNQESLDWYLGWQADAMVNSYIARKDLDSEMTVVRNEYERAENNPVQALLERMRASAYMWHNYGKSTLGAKSDIENVDIAKLQAFYRRFYRPDNALITVAGKFDSAATLARIAGAFSPLVAPDVAIASTYTLDTAQDGERSVVVRRPASSQVIINGYHTPAVLHPDNVPLAVLNLVLTAPPNGRLQKALVEPKLAQSVFGSSAGYREAGYVLYGATLGVDDNSEVQKKILLDVVEGVAQKNVTQEEFDRAKNNLSKSFELILADASFTANAAAESAVLGDWRNIFAIRDRISKVSLDDVNRVAKVYFVTSNRTSGHLVPTANPVRAPEPKLPDIAAYMADTTFISQGQASTEFDYTFANLQKKSQMTTLAQGIKLGILSKPVRGDVVTARIRLRFGSLDSLSHRRAAAQMVSNMLTRGTDKYNQQQIQDEFVRLGAIASFNAGAQGGEGSLVAPKRNFQEALNLAIHVLKASNFPAEAFDEIKSRMIKTAQGELQDKATQSNFEFNRYGSPYTKDDPRHMYTSQDWLDEVKALTREQVVDFHSQFYGAQAAQVIVVGPVDAQAVQQQVASLLESWRAPQAWERIPNPWVKKKPARFVYDTPDKSNASLRVRLQLPLSELDIESRQLQLATRIFGGGSGSRLWTSLREKNGLSYSVSANFSANRLEKSANWTIDADFAPANLAKAEAIVRQELANSLANGFNAQEFEGTKNSWLAERARLRSGDEHAINMMRGVQEFDQEWDLPLKSDALIASLTLDQINAAWRKYINPDDLVWGIFADMAKTK